MRHRRSKLRRRYGRANVWSGEPVTVRVKNASGALLRRFAWRNPIGTTTTNVALSVASNATPGDVVEIAVGKSRYSYVVGRVAGLPAVTRVRRSR